MWQSERTKALRTLLSFLFDRLLPFSGLIVYSASVSFASPKLNVHFSDVMRSRALEKRTVELKYTWNFHTRLMLTFICEWPPRVWRHCRMTPNEVHQTRTFRLTRFLTCKTRWLTILIPETLNSKQEMLAATRKKSHFSIVFKLELRGLFTGGTGKYHYVN